MCVLNKRNPESSVSVIHSIDDIGKSRDSFEVANDDLIELMKLRGSKGVDEIKKKFNTIDGLAKKLNTDLISGISGEIKDLNKRIEIFGKNEIPVKTSKSFFALMVHALKEVTLVILMICALVSIGLSFYHPPDDVVTEEKSNTKEGMKY